MSGGTVSKAYALCVNLLEMYGEEKIEQILKDEELECPSLGLSQDWAMGYPSENIILRGRPQK